MMQKSSIAMLRNGFVSQFSSKGGRRYPWGANSRFHTRWDCSYHIIFIPKFRRKAVCKEVGKEVGGMLRTLYEYKNVELVKGSISTDLVHMYVKNTTETERVRVHGIPQRKECVDGV